jgi:dihydrofolate synthase/folylpolyglutamate synthase
MSYPEAVAYLNSLGIDAMKSMAPSLHRIEALCEALNHPEASVPAIHITGTNGKTSTARIAAALLESAGLRTGTYTSPHLQTIRERIARAGEPIPKDEFGDLFDHLIPFVRHVERSVGEPLTFFEILTGMFFLWAAEAPLEAMVVEVGLGGRWDATNVVPAPVAVVTNIGLDHTGLLGTDRRTIALEKAGIIKPGGTSVTGERRPDVVEVIAAAADDCDSRLVEIGRDFEVELNRVAVGGRYLTIAARDRTYEELFLPLHGGHQGTNAAVALQSVLEFLPAGSLGDEVVKDGFAATMVPARLETLRGEGADPAVVLDVAHNPDGMSALVSSLVEEIAFDRAVIVVGILGDKDHRGMLTELTRVPCTIVATTAATVRSVPTDELERSARELGLDCTVVDKVSEAVEHALAVAEAGEIVCVTGSHYVVGEARTYLLGDPDSEIV